MKHEAELEVTERIKAELAEIDRELHFHEDKVIELQQIRREFINRHNLNKQENKWTSMKP